MKIIRLNREFNSTSNRIEFKVNKNSLKNLYMNYCTKFWILVVFWTKPLVFWNKPPSKIILSDKEFNSTSNTIKIKVEKISSSNLYVNYGEKLWISLVIYTKRIVFLYKLPWNLYGRIENWILHRTQWNLKSTKIHGRIYTRITGKNFEFHSYFTRNSTFSLIRTDENYTVE